MSTSQYLLNLGLLAYVLISNVGTRVVTKRRFTLPVVLVTFAGYTYLKSMPTGPGDVRLELLGAIAGITLGGVAAAFVRHHRDEAGRLAMTAGAGFAAVWVLVILGRIAFAFGATHLFGQQIGRFSVEHQISGAGAWTAAFVIMALAMVLTRVAYSAWRITVVAALPVERTIRPSSPSTWWSQVPRSQRRVTPSTNRGRCETPFAHPAG